MTGISALQDELVRWEKDLAALEDECTAQGWTEPETLLFTLHRTTSTYRRRVLPRITADRALVLPAIPDNQAPEALTAYAAIVADEITRLIDRLEELRIELIRFGQTAELQLRTAEALAALRALGSVVLRYGQEFEIPAVNAQLTPEQADQLTSAVHDYEKGLR